MVEPKAGRRGASVLHATALEAKREAVEALGEDATRFSAAVRRYVRAVEVADEARRQWEAEARPLMFRYANSVVGTHPLVQTMERMERQSAAFGAALGLDPMSAKRLRGGRVGRPVGAVSAPDRVGGVPLVRLRSVDPSATRES